MRSLIFLVLAALLTAALLALVIRAYLQTRRANEATWDDLLHRLTWIDREAIAAIALDAVRESAAPCELGDRCCLEPDAIWNLLGGLDGLEVLARNCKVLVELACFIQRTYPEAVMVAEQLRLNAREIEWHVGRLRGAARTGNLQSSFDAYAQQAVVSYYAMTQHVLTLYSQTAFSRVAELQQAI